MKKNKGFSSFIWRQSNGSTIFVKNMTTIHVSNSLKLVKRRDTRTYAGVSKQSWIGLLLYQLSYSG